MKRVVKGTGKFKREEIECLARWMDLERVNGIFSFSPKIKRKSLEKRRK